MTIKLHFPYNHRNLNRFPENIGDLSDEYGERFRQDISEMGSMLCLGFPHIFKYHFPYFFSTFSILNRKSSIPLLLFIFRNS